MRPIGVPAWAALASAALIAVSGCGSSGGHATVRPPAADRPGTTFIAVGDRQPAPELSGRTLTGQSLSLKRFLGRGVVVVNVWAAWCVECRAESRTLATLSRRYAPQGVRFVGIDEQDNPARARAFATSVGADYPSIVDPDGTLLAKLVLLPSDGIPSTLVIDRDGRMAARIVGAARAAPLSDLLKRVGAHY